uniref:Uncharacterized protein n=1 Tax=Cannabis sativa TaxID=3483 RepID=A0A803NLS2_CANSA
MHGSQRYVFPLGYGGVCWYASGLVLVHLSIPTKNYPQIYLGFSYKRLTNAGSSLCSILSTGRPSFLNTKCESNDVDSDPNGSGVSTCRDCGLVALRR